MTENDIFVNFWLHHVKFHCNLCGAPLQCNHTYCFMSFIYILTVKS